MKNSKNHTGISIFVAILLCLSAIIFPTSTIIDSTLLNENYVKDKLTQSGFIQQNIKEKLEKNIESKIPLNIDKIKLSEMIINPLTDNVVALTIASLYHTDKIQEIENKIRENISSTISSVFNDKNNNSLFTPHISNTKDSLITSLIDKIESDAHIKDLQNIGQNMNAIKAMTAFFKISSLIIALISLILLIILNKKNYITTSFIISAIFMSIVCLLGFFIKTDFGININNINTFITYCQSDIALKFGICGIAFIILSIISLIYSKVTNKKF